MADDPLGLVYNKRDNSGAAVVFPESRENAVDYYLRQQDQQLKRDMIARARADKILDKADGKTSSLMSKFWIKDKAYAADLKNQYHQAVAEVYKNDPLLKRRSSIDAIQAAEDKVIDASHLSEIQEKIYFAKIKDLTNYPDLYDNRDDGLKKLDDTYANVPSEQRTLAPMDPSTMRAPTADVFQYIKSKTVPTKMESKPIDIGGGVIKQVDTKVFDRDKSEAEAHLFLAENTPKSRKLMSMANSYVASAYPDVSDEDKSKLAVEWATQHYVDIQDNNWSDSEKTTLKNKPTGDATGVKKVGSSLLVGNTNWGYRTDQQGKEIFTITPVSKTGKPGQNAPTDWLDPTSSDPKNMTRGSLQGVINDNGNWTVTVSVPVMGHTQSRANVIKGYREEDIAYNEFNAGKIKGMHGLLPIEVKAKLGLSSSVLPSAAPDKVIIDKKQKESEIKQAREKTAQDKAINKYELTKTKKPKKKLF